MQSGASLFGLQESNPVNPAVAYAGNPNRYGTKVDPMVGKRIGGVNVFGGGLALYSGNKKIGALGVSGDTSCRDHAFAWRIRDALAMKAPGTGITTNNMNAAGAAQTPLKYKVAVTPLQGDEMILGNPNDVSANYWNAWAQPLCPNSIKAIALPGNGTLTTLP